MNPARILLLGFFLVAAGIVMIALGSAGSSTSSLGGVVFLGPFPIVFGSGPDSGLLAITALVIAVAMIVAFYLSILAGRRSRTED